MFYPCVGLTGKRLERFRSLFLILSALVASAAFAHFGAAPPGLSLQRTGLGYFALTITNGSPASAYEIQFSTQFPNASPWMTERRGLVGQTNFVAVPPNEPWGFYRARLADDGDGDGVPNWLDVRPDDPRFGLLTVIIKTPLNGTLIE